MPQCFGQPSGPRYWPRSPWSIGSNTSAAIPLRASNAPTVWYSSWALAFFAWPQGTSTPGYGGLQRSAAGRNSSAVTKCFGWLSKMIFSTRYPSRATVPVTLRIQRRALGQAADRGEELLPQPLSDRPRSASGLVRASYSACQRWNGRFGLALPVAFHHLPGLVAGDLVGGHVEILPAQ